MKVRVTHLVVLLQDPAFNQLHMREHQVGAAAIVGDL